MNSISTLVSFHIIEINTSLITWTFPTISDHHKIVILKKAKNLSEQATCVCYRFNEWLYLSNFSVEGGLFVLCVIATDFDPYKYEILCNIMIKKYQRTKNSVDLVKMFLNVFTQGTIAAQENGTLITHNFREYKSNTIVKEIIKYFELQIILIYIALLLKKRVVIYHPQLKYLHKALHSISKLMIHRNPNDYLFPNLEDMLDARGRTFFVTGTTNKVVLSPDFHDLFVNLESRDISISPPAKEAFAMNKTHKDIALFIVQLAADLEETQVIEQINVKTQELIAHLKTLATVTTADNKNLITLEHLRSKKLNPISENFLFNLAIAENIMML